MEIKGTIQGNCATDQPSTGRGNCDKKEGKTMALILTAMNAYYPLGAEAFKSGIEGWASVEGNMRMFPIKGVVAGALNGGDIATAELGTYGGTTPIGVNQLNIAYTIDAGDCFFKELFKVRKRKMRVFRVDDEGYVYGTVVKSGEQYYFAGFESTLMPLYTLSDGSTTTTVGLTVYYGTGYETELANKNGVNVGVANIPEGLIGLELKAGDGGKATIVTSCAGEDVTAAYGNEWAATAFVNESGTNPTTVTYENGALTIAPAGSYKVASASALAAIDIIGYEGVDVFTAITSA